MRRFVEVTEKSEIPESGAIGSHFNIKTGRVTMDPAAKDVATYRVRRVGDAVEVEIYASDE